MAQAIIFKEQISSSVPHHVSDVDAQGKAKIEPFTEKLLTQFQKAFYPYQDLSLDEMAIG
jgi:hypothetical protein